MARRAPRRRWDGRSPAIDAGDPSFVADPGETDLDGGARVLGPRVDMGADEASRCGNGVIEAPELCDDGNLVSGDGQASIALKAKGPSLPTPALPLSQSPDVTIQLRGGDACWETVLPASAARNDVSRFEDTAR